MDDESAALEMCGGIVVGVGQVTPANGGMMHTVTGRGGRVRSQAQCWDVGCGVSGSLRTLVVMVYCGGWAAAGLGGGQAHFQGRARRLLPVLHFTFFLDLRSNCIQ